MELYNILIVEDDPEISELFRLSIENAEYALSTALNGSKAIRSYNLRNRTRRYGHFNPGA